MVKIYLLFLIMLNTSTLMRASDKTEEAQQQLHKFKCALCSKSYTQKRNLKTHVRKKHGAESKRFECPTCSKRFFRKGLLASHGRIHTGECPYKCSSCGRGFKQKGNLSRHLSTCSKRKHTPPQAGNTDHGHTEDNPDHNDDNWLAKALADLAASPTLTSSSPQEDSTFEDLPPQSLEEILASLPRLDLSENETA